MQVGDRIVVDERVREPNKKIEKAYQDTLKAILQIRDNIMIERKETEDGDLIAFCIDWRLSRNWDEAHKKAAPALALCKGEGLYVVESEISPFATSTHLKWTRARPSLSCGPRWALQGR